MVRPRIDLVKRDFRNGNMVKYNSLRFYAIDFDTENFLTIFILLFTCCMTRYMASNVNNHRLN
jgi:hypothetical protein